MFIFYAFIYLWYHNGILNHDHSVNLELSFPEIPQWLQQLWQRVLEWEASTVPRWQDARWLHGPGGFCRLFLCQPQTGALNRQIKRQNTSPSGLTGPEGLTSACSAQQKRTLAFLFYFILTWNQILLQVWASRNTQVVLVLVPFSHYTPHS